MQVQVWAVPPGLALAHLPLALVLELALRLQWLPQGLWL